MIPPTPSLVARGFLFSGSVISPEDVDKQVGKIQGCTTWSAWIETMEEVSVHNIVLDEICRKLTVAGFSASRPDSYINVDPIYEGPYIHIKAYVSIIDNSVHIKMLESGILPAETGNVAYTDCSMDREDEFAFSVPLADPNAFDAVLSYIISFREKYEDKE